MNISTEEDDGPIEYKLQLVDIDKKRFQHLVTQLNYRLNEGGGEALYEIGLADDGTPQGIMEDDMISSEATLKCMAEELDAEVTYLRTREVEQDRFVSEFLIRRLCFDPLHNNEIRITTLGQVDAGKTSLIGGLTRNTLDDGRGKTRSFVLGMKHEIESGRTSSISHEYLGFDSKGGLVNRNYPHIYSDKEICERSNKIINFIDLAGHLKYLKTSVFGMCGSAPDYCILIVGSNMGIIGTTKEHFILSLSLKVPIFVVVTKIDICPENKKKETLEELKRLLKSPGSRKIPFMVRNYDDVVVCARNFTTDRLCPIFCLSNVTGYGKENLISFLNLIPMRIDWTLKEVLPPRFDIDQVNTVHGIGTVVSGTLMKGIVKTGDKLFLGPDNFGKFELISCRSIHSKRLPIKKAYAGQTASINIPKIRKEQIRKGMVLISPQTDIDQHVCLEFEGELLVLYHHTTIQVGYEAVVNCGIVRQTVKIIKLDSNVIRTGDKAIVTFKFKIHPEFLTLGSKLIFREGRTRGVGIITKIIPL
ncbi:MAG: GTP-binding protein [Candidatus Peregrinibacteria bacterium]|nr:GTP-binding protein [Candidatus Peregrinibacteria bacterium]